MYLRKCGLVYLCQVYLSICGFPGKEKAGGAAEKSAVQDHFLPSGNTVLSSSVKTVFFLN